MDRPGWRARTDNLVVADASERTLLWIPRDLWSPIAGGRINAAFARGGPPLLLQALAGHGIHADGVLCLQRAATERALAEIRLRVPVGRRLEFRYPLSPTGRIEDGVRTLAFGPGDEWLEGERIHVWLGARYTAEGAQSDLERIERQKIFLRRMLEASVPFAPFLADPAAIRTTSPAVLEELARVTPEWRFATYGPLDDDFRNGAMVLVPRGRSPLLRALRRLRFRSGRARSNRRRAGARQGRTTARANKRASESR
jgi:hypothetical protein